MSSIFEVIETEPVEVKEEVPKVSKTRKRAATKKVTKEDEEESSEEEFEEVNIETSINIPLQDLLYNIDELQDHNDKDIVIYCRSGHRSITACNLLAMEGFNKLYNLERGIIDYLK